MHNEPNRGFIKMILLVIILILALSYFGVNFRSIVNSPTGQDNLSFLQETGQKIWTFCLEIWAKYLRESVMNARAYLKGGLDKILSPNR
jgi:hypothetical protein